MKTIKLKLTKKGYFDVYVEAALSLIFKLTKTEQKVVSLILYYINEELDNKVPLEASIRLVSMYEYRVKIMEEIEVPSRKEKGKTQQLPESSLNNIMMNLREKNLVNDKNQMNATYVIRTGDGGFKYLIDIVEENDR